MRPGNGSRGWRIGSLSWSPPSCVTRQALTLQSPNYLDLTNPLLPWRRAAERADLMIAHSKLVSVESRAARIGGKSETRVPGYRK